MRARRRDVAPGGQRTALTVDGDGWLESATNPAGEAFRFTYANGLIKSFRKPKGGTTRFDYDPRRLIAHHGADGEERTLSRDAIEGGTRVTVTTGGGKQTRYSMQVLDSGDRVRTIETPTGAKTKITVGVDGITTKVDADGTKTTFETAPDPRWGAQVPVIAVQTRPRRRARRRRSSARTPCRCPSRRPVLDDVPAHPVHRDRWRDAQLGVQRRHRDRDQRGRAHEHHQARRLRPRDQADARLVRGALEYTYDEHGRPKTMKQGAER